jgi:hypothetical protein
MLAMAPCLDAKGNAAVQVFVLAQNVAKGSRHGLRCRVAHRNEGGGERTDLVVGKTYGIGLELLNGSLP